MKIKKINNKEASELRQDLVSGDWVIIATGRSKRPEDFVRENNNFTQEEKKNEDTSQCFFCHPEETGQKKDVLIYRNSKKEWTLRVFPNKYPILSQEIALKKNTQGPYLTYTGYGFHEIIVTRNHFHSFALMKKEEVAEVFDAFQERYLALMKQKNIHYISIFHNYGKEAGASIAHPHSQLLAIPVVSPYVTLELEGAKNYFKHTRHCVYCTMIDYEREEKRRIVFENEDFIAFCPFASRSSFEVWVMPKKHNPYYERITDENKISLSEVFQKVMYALYKTLNNPALNFYIHTSPCDGKDYGHYHWHIEILPRTSKWAGFELETGVEVTATPPEEAAQYLREQLVNSETDLK